MMMTDALDLLRADHNRVKDLFHRYEKSADRSEKREIAATAILEIRAHAQVEEDVFYPAVKKQIAEAGLLRKGEEEHHVAGMIMDELSTMRLDAISFDAKFAVLAEHVKRHIDEEEGEMFPKAAEAGSSALARIGQMIEERALELKHSVKRANGTRRPAASAHRGTPRPRAATPAARNGTARARTRRTGRAPAASSKRPAGARRRATSPRGGR